MWRSPLKPSTLLIFHGALVQRKYRLLFSTKQKTSPGPKGPAADLIRVVVEMKRRDPAGDVHISPSRSIWHSERLLIRIWFVAFWLSITGPCRRQRPSWLTFIGHMKDSLWSLDLFRCESATLRTYWVLVVMDQHARQSLGLAFTVEL